MIYSQKSLDLLVWWGLYGSMSSYFKGNQLVKPFSFNLTLLFCVLWFPLTWGCRKHGQSPNQRLDDWKNILSYGPFESFPIWKFNRHFFNYSSDPLEISQGILNILTPLSSAPWNKLIGGENTGGRRRSPGPNWLQRHNLSLFFSPTPQLMSINEFKVWGK